MRAAQFWFGLGFSWWLVLGLVGISWGRTDYSQPLQTPTCFIRFHYDTPGAKSVSLRCAEIWQAEGTAFTAALLSAEVVPDTVDCFILSSDAFAQKFSNQLPDWGVGVALGPRLVALDYTRIPAVGRGVREIFLHEMTHALIYQGAGTAWVPAWFHEGVAMQMSGEWRFWDTVSLVLDGQVPDLNRLQNRWPSLAVPSSRAYRTSLLAVGKLQDRFGSEIVGSIMAATHNSGTFASGFATATGIPLASFYTDFHHAMRLRFGWLTLFSHWPGLFVLMAVGFAIGAVRKIILARRRLAEMAEEESSYPE